jgi:hypothetical protein
VLTGLMTTPITRIGRPSPSLYRRWFAIVVLTTAVLIASAAAAAASPVPLRIPQPPDPLNIAAPPVSPNPPLVLNSANWAAADKVPATEVYGAAAPGFYLDQFGMVHLEGAVTQTSNAGTGSQVIGTLGPAARPDRDVFTIVHTFDGTYADLEITIAGTLLVTDPPSPAVTDLRFLSLESIVYPRSDSNQKFPANGPDWGADPADPPAWTQPVAGGPVYLEGIVKPGDFDDGPSPDIIGWLPEPIWPSHVVYTIVNANGGSYADLAIQTDGAIQLINPRPPAVPNNNSVSLEGVSYDLESSAASPIFPNEAAWVASNQVGGNPYDPASPGWYEDDAGIIHLEGAVTQTNANDPISDEIATLPQAAYPSRNVYAIVHTFDGTYADVWIGTNGTISVIGARGPAVTDLSFLSLEGITWEAASPEFFGLDVHGSEAQGATVTMRLRKARTLALVVQVARGHRLLTVGVVHVGRHPAGLSRIAWNLRVDGRLLRAGAYEVSLDALNGRLLSVPAAPGPRRLVVRANGQILIQRPRRIPVRRGT